MTEEAKAVLFLLQEDGTMNNDVFLGSDFPSPYHAAESLREACRNDFPGATWAIGQNEASTKLMGRENMRRMGFKDEELDA
jgi:hypothetical protein